MKRGGVIFILVIASLLLVPTILAEGSIDDEIKKIGHYAEEYETGNIDYVKFVLHTSIIRESLNEKLGAVRFQGGLLKQDQIEDALGEPDEETKWVWVEGEDREKKLDEALPIWRKIVFDGKKIQIRLEAYPSIFKIGFDKTWEDEEWVDEEDKKEYEEKKKRKEEFQRKLLGGDETIIYRLHFQVEFKKPEKQIDISGKIVEIKDLAEIFNSDPSRKNAEILAKESVIAERMFESFLKQEGGECVDIMKGIFGTENERDLQKMLLQEIEFYDTDHITSTIRLEMCEDCEWQWINLEIWYDTRNMRRPMEGDGGDDYGESRDRYSKYSFDFFESQITSLLEKYKQAMDNENFKEMSRIKSEIRKLNEGWNEKSNNVWEDIDREFQAKRDIFEREREAFEEKYRDREQREEPPNYDWEEEEIQRRLKEITIRKNNYERRRKFYLNLFADYDKKEYYYEQREFEKKLVENFREHNREKCDNDFDDNEDGFQDCLDDQCAGKVCGEEIIETFNETTNQTTKDYKNKYCIKKICQLKEEGVDEGPVCGNNICEPGEKGEFFKPRNEKSIQGGGNKEPEVPETESEIVIDDGTVEAPVTSSSSGGGGGGLLTGNVIAEEETTDESLPEEVGEADTSVSEGTVTEGDIDEVVDGETETEEEEDESEPDWDRKGRNPRSLICPKDCVVCPAHPPIKCDGQVVFSGEDENGCKLKPICLREEETCESDEDCTQPLCGIAKCKKGACKTIDLDECEEEECTPGDEQIEKCKGEKLVVAVCVDGLWKETGVDCEDSRLKCVPCGDGCMPKENIETAYCEKPTKDFYCTEEDGECEAIEEEHKPVFGEECEVKSDCGGEDDVCSNGKCITIPKTEEEEDDWEEIEIEIVEEDYEKYKDDYSWEDEIELEEKKDGEMDNSKGYDQDNSYEEKDHDEGEGMEPEVTGNMIFNFFRGLLSITGFSTADVEGDDGGDVTNEEPKEEPPPEEPPHEEPPEEPTAGGGGEGGDWEEGDEYHGDNRDDDDRDDEDRDDEDDWKDREREDDKRRMEDCVNRCDNECTDRLTGPCVGDCFWQAKCEDEECLRETRAKCKEECLDEKSGEVEDCVKECKVSCENQEGFEIEDQWEENKEHAGTFAAGGNCRTSQGKTEAFVWFHGWGDPFDKLNYLKNKFYEGGETNWCKWDLENLIKQRKELEKGFNQEFAEWFIEKFLANSAEDWEQHMSGIYELYWRVVDNQREIYHRMECLGKDDIDEVMDYELISFEYKTDYASIEYWEEITEVDPSRLDYKPSKDRGKKKVKIITPYMKVWMFPTKEVMKYEFEKAMKNHEFPGSPEENMERGNKGGLKEDEKEVLRDSKKFMKRIKKVAERYNGNARAVFQLIDKKADDEVVFNLYMQLNEEEIIEMEPMLPEDNPEYDVKIELSYDKVFNFIHSIEKSERKSYIETPPWAERKKGVVGGVKDMVNGVKMYFKMRSIIRSAKVTPKSDRKDVRSLATSFFKIVGGDKGHGGGPGDKGDKGGGDEDEDEERMKEMDEEMMGGSKGSLTGNCNNYNA